MSPEHQAMVAMRADGHTLEDIAQQFNLTRERVRQVTSPHVPASEARASRRRRREAEVQEMQAAIEAAFVSGKSKYEVREEFNLTHEEWIQATAAMDEYSKRVAASNRAIGFRKEYDDEVLLIALQDCAEEIGRTPGIYTFNDWIGNTSIAQSLVARHDTWRQACVAAGLKPNKRHKNEKFGGRKYSDEDVKLAYHRIRRIVGRRPTIGEWAELRQPNEITNHAIRKRYKHWIMFIEEMER